MATSQRPEDIQEIALEPYHTTTTSDVNASHGLDHTLLTSDDAEGNVEYMTKAQAWNLYTTHMLSTWNARTYEFAAVSYLHTE